MIRFFRYLVLGSAAMILTGCVDGTALRKAMFKQPASRTVAKPVAKTQSPPGSLYCYRDSLPPSCLSQPDERASERLFWYVGPTPASSAIRQASPQQKPAGKLYPLGDVWTLPSGQPVVGGGGTDAGSGPLVEPKPRAAPRMSVQKETLPLKEPAPKAAPRQKVQAEELEPPGPAPVPWPTE